jgi:hypothetical protein
MKKSMFLLAMVVLLTLLAAPMVLAQEEERCPDMPEVPCHVDPESGLYQILYTVYCGTVTGDPAESCIVDQNGLITLPDGTKAPYTVAADHIDGPDGIYEFMDGEFVLVEAYPPAPPVEPEFISPEYCAVYSADGHCETFRAPYE